VARGRRVFTGGTLGRAAQRAHAHLPLRAASFFSMNTVAAFAWSGWSDSAIAALLACAVTTSLWLYEKYKSGQKGTLEFIREFLTEESFVLRSYGMGTLNLPADEYARVIAQYLGRSDVRIEIADRTHLFLHLSKGEALAVFINKFRYIKLLIEERQFSERGIRHLRFHLEYWQPALTKLLDDMHAVYAQAPGEVLYHPWFQDIPWLYERCGIEFSIYARLPQVDQVV
jgi:hypothetical protein